jgi:rhomboid protease GluP
MQHHQNAGDHAGELNEPESNSLLHTPDLKGRVIVRRIRWYSHLIPNAQNGGTLTLAALIVFAFILLLVRGADPLFPDAALVMEMGGNIRILTLEGEYWRLLTSMFLHYGILHLLVNIAALMFIGPRVERLTGTFNFVCFYMFTGLIGSAASLAWNINVVAAGASGAIFGMFGLYVGLLSSGTVHEADKKTTIAIMSAFLVAEIAGGIGLKEIDNAAHIGGLVSGLVSGWAAGSYIARQHGNSGRIGVNLAALVITFTLIGITIAVTPNTIRLYGEKMATFELRDKEAIAILKNLTFDKEEALYQVNDRAMYYIQENIKLLEEIKKWRLPEELEEKNAKFLEYSKLRLESLSLYTQMIETPTGEALAELSSMEKKISQFVDQIR